MVIISSREFRANQGKYLGMAVNGKSVVLHSRSHGSFKLVPISGDDAVMTEEEFTQRINEGLRQIQEGKSTTVKGKQELNAFLDSL